MFMLYTRHVLLTCYYYYSSNFFSSYFSLTLWYAIILYVNSKCWVWITYFFFCSVPYLTFQKRTFCLIVVIFSCSFGIFFRDFCYLLWIRVKVHWMFNCLVQYYTYLHSSPIFPTRHIKALFYYHCHFTIANCAISIVQILLSHYLIL